MAIVAHPDDLEYGAAGAIAHFTDQGKEIAYVLASAGEAGIDGMTPAEAVRCAWRRSAAVPRSSGSRASSSSTIATG